MNKIRPSDHFPAKNRQTNPLNTNPKQLSSENVKSQIVFSITSEIGFQCTNSPNRPVSGKKRAANPTGHKSKTIGQSKREIKNRKCMNFRRRKNESTAWRAKRRKQRLIQPWFNGGLWDYDWFTWLWICHVEQRIQESQIRSDNPFYLKWFMSDKYRYGSLSNRGITRTRFWGRDTSSKPDTIRVG